jgi:hypothetical protein
MTTTYSKHSPYSLTTSYGTFLDVLTYRPISKTLSDVEYSIDMFYQYRPDVLAYDLYDNAGLWWVFAVRNPNILIDPIFDFVSGKTIFIPKKEALVAQLGI